MTLRAPFPWFGGKSRVAGLVWDRFGAVPNYVEPFAGSLAVLLARPHEPGTETVNDADCYLSNFWRAVQHDPVEVALWAGWPVNEADLLARHRWLAAIGSDFFERIRTEAEFYNPKVAGWWLWGICSWIGSGWCRVRGDGDPPEAPAPRGRGEGDSVVDAAASGPAPKGACRLRGLDSRDGRVCHGEAWPDRRPTRPPILGR